MGHALWRISYSTETLHCICNQHQKKHRDRSTLAPTTTELTKQHNNEEPLPLRDSVITALQAQHPCEENNF